MKVAQAKWILISLCVAGFLAMPAAAQVQSVTFSTTRNVKFF
jgi:hypothetical protein